MTVQAVASVSTALLGVEAVVFFKPEEKKINI
jgi:hypothetical protein